MKKVVLLFLFIVMIFSVRAQTWVSTGAMWHYSANYFYQTGYIKIEKTGDTIIAGKNCDILSNSRYVYDYPSGNYYNYLYFDTNYTYQDSGKVYFWINNSFRKLYDFNVQVGDTFFVKETFVSSGFCNVQDTSIVDSVGTMIINGDTLKFYHLNSFQVYSWHYSGRIVEKIGCMGYLFPENNCILDYFENGPLRCFSDSSGWAYQTSAAPSCDFIIGVNELSEKKWVSIFPNPSSGMFSISSSEKIVGIEIFNLLGEKVENWEWRDIKMEIDLSTQPKGIYFLKVKDEIGNCSVQKIIIQ